MDVVLGVDGGNSKTIALVASPDGRILGSGRGGTSDIYGAVSAEAALAELQRAVEGALRTAGVSSGEIDCSAFSMAGADWPEDFDFLTAALTERGFGREVIVVNDAIGALRGGSRDGTGVAVVCGTAAAVGARSSDGKSWHSGWWQEVHGGEQLGHKALRAVYRAELGIDPATTLTARALEIFDRHRVEDILHLFTTRGVNGRHDMGRMTRVLLEEADRGDPAARQIVESHGSALGDYANAAARRVGLQGTEYTLVLAGGVLRHPGRLLTDALIARVHRLSPEAIPRFARFEPALGAVLLALDMIHPAVDNDVLERIAATAPPVQLFAT